MIQVQVENALELSSNSVLTYNVTIIEDMKSLIYDISVMTDILFSILPANLFMIKYKASILEAVENIRSRSMTSVIYRADRIDDLLKEYVDIVSGFQKIKSEGTYENDTNNFSFKSEYHNRAYYAEAAKLKKFSKNLHRAIRPLAAKEDYELDNRLYALKMDSIRRDGRAISVVPVSLSLKNLNDDSVRLFIEKRNSRNRDVNNSATNPSAPQLEDPKSQTTENWLELISPDVLNAYLKTEDTLREVLPLLDNAEDEYFVEQVRADYYPHIFAALKKFDTEKADFEHKEIVVKESIKQFQIVQLGLQKIIDGSVVRHMKALCSQTDFLRNKVLGDVGLSLTTMEADNLIQDSVEEADRIREELYKKHVIPILEQNKQEYEAALVTAKAALSLELEANRKVMEEKEAKHLAEKTEIAQQVEEVLFDLDETKKDHEYALFEVRAELTQQVEDKTWEMEAQKVRHNSTIAEVTVKVKEIHVEITQLKQRHAQEVADLTRKLQMASEKPSMGRISSKQLAWTPLNRDYASMSKSEELELKELQEMIRRSNELRNQLDIQSDNFAELMKQKGITQKGYGRTSGREMHGANIAWIEATLASLEDQLEQTVRMEEKSSTALKNKGFEILVQQLYKNAEFQEACRAAEPNSV